MQDTKVTSQDPQVDVAREQFLDGAAAGTLLRGMADGSLADMEPEDVFDMASDASANSEVLSSMFDVPEQDVQYINPLAVREAFMVHYDTSRSVDSLANALTAAQTMKNSMKASRFDSVLSHVDATGDQRGRIELDVANGDRSAINHAMECFFFE